MKDALFSLYLEEVFGEKTIFLSDGDLMVGFVTYVINSAASELHGRNIYVHPEYRKSGHFKRAIEELEKAARENGCKYIAGTITRPQKVETRQASLRAMLSDGFKVFGWSEEAIVLTKDVS